MPTEQPKDSAQIVSLKIKNFLSIADVEIRPGKVNQIVGRNNQAKTSILKALEFAINGTTDPAVVKFGEDAAEVVVELADQTTIRRRINAEGRQSVEVKRDGLKATSPQAYLEAMFDHSSFNPLELLDPKKRSDAIMQSIAIKMDAVTLSKALQVNVEDMPPLDYNQHGLKVLEQAHKFFFQRRAEANKDTAEKRKRWETYKADFKEPTAPTMQRKEIEYRRQSANDGIAQLEGIIARIAERKKTNDAARTKLTRYSQEQDRIRSLAEDIRAKIKALESDLAVTNARLEESERVIEDAKRDVPEIEETDGEYQAAKRDLQLELNILASAEKEIEAFESIGRQREMIDGMERELRSAEAFAQALTARVTALAGDFKNQIMSQAEMPIAGLTYVDGEFFVDGVAVDHLSSSKALKLAIGVARKMAKKHKLICIDGAELLDEETYKTLHAEIEGDGFTYFLTKVGDPFPGDDAVFRMEGGRVLQ